MALNKNSLGSFEETVLYAIIDCGHNAYGYTIRTRIADVTKKSISVGALYATLDRLKEKRLISYELTEGGEEREGRPKRLYKIEPAGKQAIIDAEQVRRAFVPDFASI